MKLPTPAFIGNKASALVNKNEYEDIIENLTTTNGERIKLI